MKNADEIKLKVSATASYSKSTMNVSCSKARGMVAIQIREHARKEMSKIEKQVAKMLLKKQFLVLTTPIKKHLFQVYTNKWGHVMRALILTKIALLSNIPRLFKRSNREL